MNDSYELVVGLETHVELSTQSKIFCSCPVRFGAEPNTCCCPVCTGQPGTLPVLNREVVRDAALAGLALHCTIRSHSQMSRKNYTYPDLPKAYQITQQAFPICENGWMDLSSGRRIRIQRIHIEEDAGKIIYRDGSPYVDYNRAGVPLIEIVTQPDFRSGEEIKEYLEQIRQIMRYLKISDCRMQEGSLRCDVNLSVRLSGETAFGTRTEIKNMNSISNIAKAVDFEFRRQTEILSRGGAVLPQTLRYQEKDGSTQPMRGKESSPEYRYFPDPDLYTVFISQEEIQSLRRRLPELPAEKQSRYVHALHLPENIALLLIRYPAVAEYFENALTGVKHSETLAHWITGPLFRRMETEGEKEEFSPSVSWEQLRELALFLEEGKLSPSGAKTLLEKMLDTGKSCTEFFHPDEIREISGEMLKDFCREAINSLPKAVSDYKNGKEKALKALLGFVMKKTESRGDAAAIQQLLQKMLA